MIDRARSGYRRAEALPAPPRGTQSGPRVRLRRGKDGEVAIFFQAIGLSFTGELIAWTYAMDPNDPDSPDHFEFSFSAYAKVTEITDCE